MSGGRRRSVRTKTIVVAVGLLLIVASAFAYKLYPFWWKSKQIVMRTGGLGSGGPSGGGNYQQIAISAMNAWYNSCNPDPDFTWNRSAQNCSFKFNSSDGINCTDHANLGQCSQGTVTLGVTYLFGFGSTITEADIAMNSSCNFTQTSFLGVLTHEDGHAMGLDHSNSASALMYPFYNGTINAPRLDDCNGARARYGSVQSNHTLGVSKNGSGTVTSTPSGINCGGNCSASFPSGTVVNLNANAAAGWIFSHWSGSSDCTDGSVTMNANKSCIANFDRTRILTVTKSGGGSGTVKSTPPGINCGSDCDEPFIESSVVLLSGYPVMGHELTAWSGNPDCNDGQITMSSAQTCDAEFNLCSSVSELQLPARQVSGLEVHGACNTIEVLSNVEVTATGELVLQAGNQVVFDPGFSVESGGELRVVIGQPMP